MSADFEIEFHGYTTMIASNVWTPALEPLAEAIYSLTPHDSNELASAKWAWNKAIILAAQLKLEAEKIL